MCFSFLFWAELYPEGPSILSELIQNADDAGASTVRVMYNAKRYGSTSLLGQKMAAWQVGQLLLIHAEIRFRGEVLVSLVV